MMHFLNETYYNRPVQYGADIIKQTLDKPSLRGSDMFSTNLKLIIKNRYDSKCEIFYLFGKSELLVTEFDVAQ